MNETNQNASTNPLDDFFEEVENTSANPFNNEESADVDPFEEAEVEKAAPPVVSQEPPAASPVSEAPQAPTPAQPQNTASATPPPATVQTPQPEQTNQQQTLTGDVFAETLAKAQAKSNQIAVETVAAVPPKISYAKVKEDIDDPSQTFDELRQKYETDFPELSEKKRVSWTVLFL